MAQHDYSIANQSGASFRADLNNALAAIVSQNSGASEPSTTYAYMPWADTTTGLLKFRNAANNAWVTVGTLASVNLGLATADSPSFSGTATFSGNVLLTGTGAIDIPAGTTAQRPGTPSSGMIRYNTTTSAFEGYNGSAWGGIAGNITNADISASAGIVDSKLTGTTCKAWVNFNGTGTVAIRASFNVSSITDNGSGDYRINFSSALADANYVSVGMAGRSSTDALRTVGVYNSQSTASFRVLVIYPTSGFADDPEICNLAVFR